MLALAGSAAAALLGRFLGWAFGLRIALPLIAAMVVLAYFRKRARPAETRFGPALAVLAADYVLSLLRYFAALLSPPDPISQIGLSIPMYALYEFSIFAVRWVEKQRAEREAAEAAKA